MARTRNQAQIRHNGEKEGREMQYPYTPDGAYQRVIQARISSLLPQNVNPDYLAELRRHVQAWLDTIDDAIAEDINNAEKIRKGEEA